MTALSGLLLALLVVLLLHFSDGKGEKYKEKEIVPVIASKVGPILNPSETYAYYTLPFCQPEQLEHQSHSLGEVLSGDRKVKTRIEVRFKVPYSFQRICKINLSVEEVKRLHTSIDQDWYYEMLIDGLPLWGYVGGMQTPSADFFLKTSEGAKALEEFKADLTSKKFIYTHLIFTIDYNGDYIVAVNVQSSLEHRLDITELKETTVDFTYQVEWRESDISPDMRVEKFQKGEVLPATVEIHWLSIINSFMLVVFLTVFLAVILLRTLKNDFTRYIKADNDMEELGEDDSGWKLIHGDVFRFPQHKTLFCAVLGAGTHLFCSSFLLIMLVCFNFVDSEDKGAVSMGILMLYALTASTSGYVTTTMFKMMDGEGWVWPTVLSATLLPGPLLLVFSTLNSIAIYYGSSAALPFGTIIAVFSMYVLVTFPLAVVGGILGKRSAIRFKAPCRTSKIKRQIPAVAWFRSPLLQSMIAGFLPFSSIYIELHFIFSSIWGHKVYTLFGILFLAFVLLVTVTCFITIALIYFQLTIEDHRWWWRSVQYGGATSLFVFAYSIFYYYQRSAMNGVLQTSFFLGYMAVVSYCFFLFLGTVGFFSSLLFVKTIYAQLKLD